MHRILALLAIATALTVTLAVPAAEASSSYYWPAYFKRSFIESCSAGGGDVITCGCFVRALQRTMPYSEAWAADQALTYGNRVKASSMRKLRAAMAAC